MAKVRKTNRKNPARPRTMFKAGHRKVGGRKKGTPNKFSGELKMFVLDALANARAQGQRSAGALAYLQNQAARNPKTFLQLISRLLPNQITGKDGGPIDLLVQRAQGGLSNLTDKELATLMALLDKAGLKGDAG